MYRNFFTHKKRNAILFHWSEIFNENTDYQATKAQLVEHAIAARTVLGWSLGHSLLLGQNLGTCVRCERIAKNGDCYYKTCFRKWNEYA